MPGQRGKISDKLATHEVPEPNYPKGQLQSRLQRAKDFGAEQNWSNPGARAYEDALRKFAEDSANSIKTAEVGPTAGRLNVQQLRNVIERGSLGVKMSASTANKRDAADYGELIGRFVDHRIDAGNSSGDTST